MAAFLDKLKGDVIVLIVGLLVGIPALGILLPNLFTYLSERSTGHFELSCLLRIYSMLYFTIPFYIIFAGLSLSAPKPSNAIIRKYSQACLLFMFIFSGLFIFFHAWGINHNSTVFIFSANMLLFLVFISLTLQIISAGFSSTGKLIIPVAFASLIFLWVQWAISLFLTVVINADKNSFYVFVFCFLHILTLVFFTVTIAKKHRATFAVAAGVFTVILLFIIKYGSEKNPTYPFTWEAEQRQYDTLFYASVQLDSVRAEQQKVNKLLGIYELEARKDSLEKLSVTAAFVTSQTGTGNINRFAGEFWDSLYAEKDIISLRNHFFPDTAHQFPLEKRIRLITGYQQYLLQQHTVSGNLTRSRLLILVKDLQRTGILIFLSTILILLFFLFVLYKGLLFASSSSSSVTIKEEDEFQAARQTLQLSLLIVCILLFPLLRTLKESDLDPDRPFNLYHVPAWNISVAVQNDKPIINNNSNQVKISLKDSCCKSAGTGPITVEFPEDITKQLSNIAARLEAINETIAKIKITDGKRDSLSAKLSLTNTINANLDSFVQKLSAINKTIHEGQEPVKAIAEEIKDLNDQVKELKIIIHNLHRKQP